MIVTDVIGVKKPLVPQAWKTDEPKVTFDAKGKPTLKLPKTKPPKDLLLKVLRQGDGDVVKTGDTVTVDYQGTSWDTGKIFDQSYGKQPASFATNQVVEGFGAALVGQKVGHPAGRLDPAEVRLRRQGQRQRQRARRSDPGVRDRDQGTKTG